MSDGDDEAARPRLLLAEDDRQLGPLLADALGDHYQVTLAKDGHTALHLGLSRTFDAIVLDRGLPAVEGLDVLRKLRASGVTTGVIVLTARGTLAERIDGLDAGAEDYLVKPFELDELMARLRALVRRHRSTAQRLPVPGGLLDVSNRVVVSVDAGLGDTGPGEAGPRDVEVSLTERECDLLELLARRPTVVFTREDLLARVFDSAGADNTVDTYVSYLRRKLGHGVITTVHGLGYRLGRSK